MRFYSIVMLFSALTFLPATSEANYLLYAYCNATTEHIVLSLIIMRYNNDGFIVLGNVEKPKQGNAIKI